MPRLTNCLLSSTLVPHATYPPLPLTSKSCDPYHIAQSRGYAAWLFKLLAWVTSNYALQGGMSSSSLTYYISQSPVFTSFPYLPWRKVAVTPPTSIPTCWVTNKSDTTLIHGSLLGKCLYVLTTKTPAPHTKASNTQLALFARVPDVKTWHHRLGHCNTWAIIEMAKNGVSQGMPIDLSSLPPKCDHCTIRKQMHSPVPKIQEGKKATEHLGRVYMDLCGQMAVMSQSRKLYCMNIINNFSSYV